MQEYFEEDKKKNNKISSEAIEVFGESIRQLKCTFSAEIGNEIIALINKGAKAFLFLNNYWGKESSCFLHFFFNNDSSLLNQLEELISHNDIEDAQNLIELAESYLDLSCLMISYTRDKGVLCYQITMLMWMLMGKYLTSFPDELDIQDKDNLFVGNVVAVENVIEQFSKIEYLQKRYYDFFSNDNNVYVLAKIMSKLGKSYLAYLLFFMPRILINSGFLDETRANFSEEWNKALDYFQVSLLKKIYDYIFLHSPFPCIVKGLSKCNFDPHHEATFNAVLNIIIAHGALLFLENDEDIKNVESDSKKIHILCKTGAYSCLSKLLDLAHQNKYGLSLHVLNELKFLQNSLFRVEPLLEILFENGSIKEVEESLTILHKAEEKLSRVDGYEDRLLSSCNNHPEETPWERTQHIIFILKVALKKLEEGTPIQAFCLRIPIQESEAE